MRATTLACPRCAFEQPDTARFCGRCGAPVRSTSHEEGSSSPRRHRRARLTMIVSPVVIGGLVAAVIVVGRAATERREASDASVPVPQASDAAGVARSPDGFIAVAGAAPCRSGSSGAPIACVVRERDLLAEDIHVVSVLPGHRVGYVATDDGDVMALDGHGRERWRSRTGLDEPWLHLWGPSRLVATDHTGFAVLDARTGRRLWRAPGGGTHSSYPGIVWRSTDGSDTEPPGPPVLQSVDPDTGKLRWSFAGADLGVLVDDTVVVVQAPNLPGSGADQPNFSPAEGAVVIALDATTGDERWRVADRLPIDNQEGTRGLVLLQTAADDLEARDALTGELHWQRPRLDPGAPLASWAVESGPGLELVATAHGAIVNTSSRPRGDEPPAVTVRALDPWSGDELWRQGVPDMSSVWWIQPADGDRILLVGADPAAAIALLRASDGMVLWTRPGGLGWPAPFFVGPYVPLVGDDGLTMVDLVFGETAVEIPTPRGRRSAPLEPVVTIGVEPGDVLVVGPRTMQWIDVP